MPLPYKSTLKKIKKYKKNIRKIVKSKEDNSGCANVFIILVVLGLAIHYLPLVIGGVLVYLLYKNIKPLGPKAISITIVAILSFSLLPAWSKVIDKPVTPLRSETVNSEPPVENTASGESNLSAAVNNEGDEGERSIEEKEIEQAKPVSNEGLLVTRVIDGDTVELENGKKVRYIGINTPETVHPSKPVECFGKEASWKNNELVGGKRVRLEKDVSETDRYGRLLRYIWVGDVFVNDYLVRQGYANASSYPPDVKYQSQFTQAEREARENSRGLWSSCPASVPTSTPVVTPVPTQVSGDCKIKGNISWDGEKIYHLPGCGSYDRTKIDAGRGERWFCSESEAQSSGWRKAKNC